MNFICSYYGQAATVKTRYSFKRADFNKTMLKEIVRELPSEYILKRMDSNLVSEASKQWCKGLANNFDPPDDFFMRDIGYCILIME
jgi:hypothetical protein